MLRSVAPWVGRCVIWYLTHALLGKGLEHDAEDSFAVVLLVHVSPPIKIGAHSWDVVLLHVCCIEILDGESCPTSRGAEDIVQPVISCPW